MSEDYNERIKQLEELHKHQHKIVEAIKAEKAPADSLARAKKVKLRLKDQIAALKK